MDFRSSSLRRARAAVGTGVVAMVAATGVVAVAEEPALGALESVAPATVSVDFGRQQGELKRSERFNNFGNVTAWPDQRADDVEFFNEQGLRGEVYRVWLSSPNASPEENVFNQCDLGTQTCDFSPLDAYLTEASTVSESVLVNVNPTDFIEGRRPVEDLEPLLELILRNLKDRYPNVRYVEVFNEPDWQFHGLWRRIGMPQRITLHPEDLYRFYVPFYEAVHDVNRQRAEADRLLVGGPAFTSLDGRWMEPFLDAFAADASPHKRLDFLSYHAYLAWDEEYKRPTLYKGDLSVVASERARIEGWLRERRIPAPIPAFVTETGIYPGPAFDSTDPTDDYLRQATGMATYGYLYADQPNTFMFNWCVRHRVEERKDQLVTRTDDGPLVDTFTPYGNMLRMQSMMKDTRVAAASDGPIVDGDNGVYAMAAKDGTGASAMVWNWQHVHDETFRTTIDMSRLPSELHGGMRQQLFRIDGTTSNYFGDPEKADLQLVEEQFVVPGKTHQVTVDLEPNAMYLIVMEAA